MPEVIAEPEARDAARARTWRLVGKLTDRLIGLGVAAVLIASVYVLYSLMTGDFVNLPASEQSRERVLSNAELAANVILIGSIATTVIAIVRWGWQAAPAYVAGAWGLLLYFLAPWGLAVSLASTAQPANSITTLLGWTFQMTGQVLLILVLVRVVVGLVYKVAVGRDRVRAPVELTLDEEKAEERKVRRHRSLLRNCWELSLCRAEMREYCPAYLQRKSCWRRGEGCLCDPLFTQRVLETAEREQGIRVSTEEREARDRRKREAHVELSPKARRARCRACPIYNEHQHYKYRAFFWIAYPITAGVVWMLMDYIHLGYVWFATILNKLVSSAAFLPDVEAETRPFMSIVLETKGIEFLVVVAAAFVVVSYLLELVEYFVFEVKV